MARRKIERSALLSATESLLIEQGYQGFHLKALSERLKIGRSTLYEYYASKEELVMDYLEHILEIIIEECDKVPSTDHSVDILKGMLKIFLKYSQIHQIALVIPFIDPDHSPEVKASLLNLKRDHELLYKRVTELIETGKKEREIRDTIETPVIAGMIFNTIQVPNVMKIPEEQWSEMVLDVLFNGIGN